MTERTGVEDGFELQYVVVHGHRRAFRRAGTGPALLLVHGLGCDSSTWLPALPALAEHFTVVAPDLLGHGASDKPRGDYSLGGYANGMRDLLSLLRIDKATVVGHSFGGGVALQFAYQFPERAERIVLVAPGGMGSEVSVLLRALTLPGAGLAVAAAGLTPLRPFVRTGLRVLSRSRIAHLRDLDEVADVYASMCDPSARQAIRHATRQVVDWRGQVVTMTDRAYLTRLMPMCVVWGERDRVIPSRHARTVATCAPGAEVHVLERSGHFPHKDHPARFVRTVLDFIESTSPASYHRGRWRGLMRRGDGQPLTPVSSTPPTSADATA
ncbi:MAG: alpha/beta fold hydrolase [Actinomycetota bacterium]|nr:alpha/beta fold hydrolase [Actinomycetota bacterium]